MGFRVYDSQIGRISGELLPLIDEYLKEVQYLWVCAVIC